MIDFFLTANKTKTKQKVSGSLLKMMLSKTKIQLLFKEGSDHVLCQML